MPTTEIKQHPERDVSELYIDIFMQGYVAHIGFLR